jgi:hypothetical protein
MGTVLNGYVAGYRGTAESLLARIAELELRDYPTELSRALLSVLRGAIEASARVVDELAAEGEEEAEAAVVRHSQLLGYIHWLVHLVSNSVGSDVPRWAIQPMKHEVSRYIQQSADILIVGSDAGGNFAYDYRIEGLKRILTQALDKETADGLTRDLPEHMAVFHFPFAERDNVLAHGAFFHEVGHQIDIAILGLSQRVVQQFLTEKDAEIRERIWKAVGPSLQHAFGRAVGTPRVGEQRTFEDDQADVLVEQSVKHVQQVMVYWSREFCADLIATRILGPAYAMVIAISPTLLGALRAHAATHPATLLRLRLVLSLLSDSRTGNFFDDCAEAMTEAGIRELLLQWRDRCAGEDTTSFKWPRREIGGPNEVNAVAAALGEELADRVCSAVIRETQDQGYYTPDRYTENIRELMPVLNSWIPINEEIDYAKRKHRPSDMPTIFNVGVACYLRQDSAEGRARIRRLLQKSIELSEVQRVLQS